MRRDRLYKFLIGVVVYGVMFCLLSILFGDRDFKKLASSALFFGVTMSFAMSLFLKPMTKMVLRLFHSKEHIQKMEENGEFDRM
ncbi:MAG: hypothetical protein H6551_01155 [Chitinophagales bacterium]|nr:hypothetical protein [Chitinophagaceae bacterium]MCB9063732.1 hypothetical protein [Chitinophagales bacterium]